MDWHDPTSRTTIKAATQRTMESLLYIRAAQRHAHRRASARPVQLKLGADLSITFGQIINVTFQKLSSQPQEFLNRYKFRFFLA
jgi:hypothetical protein